MNWYVIIIETLVLTAKKYHFVQSCWGMLIGLIPCLIGAGIYAGLFL